MSPPPGSRSRPALSVKVVGGIDQVPAAAWNACAGVDGPRGNPFVSHAFLAALEDSGCVGDGTGWLPRHLVIEDADARPVACAPVYAKGNSYGEYVFDWSWADAYQRAGGHYYPKLLCAVPFTPVPGPRLLVRPQAERAGLRAALAQALAGFADQAELSSAHVNFIGAEDAATLEDAGYLGRLGLQYHWRNPGYATFDDFLATLSSRKRKAIRRERRAVAEAGVTLRTLEGRDIAERHWDAFFRFYLDTGGRKWGRPYLNRAFFSRLAETLPERIVLVLAERDGRPIAGALNLRDDEALYGRYWGCVEDVPFLHFEACYHQAVDYAIAHGLARVEAGAQGEHKIQRGYEPTITRSAHWIVDPGFRHAVARYLDQERDAVTAEAEALAEMTPYRRG